MTTNTYATTVAKPVVKPMTITVPSPEFDAAVHDYLMRNPEAITDAIGAMQEKEEAKQAADTESAIAANADKVYNDPNSPVAGNPKGNEVLVEFFDYSCHYCKQIHPDIQALLKSDPNLKVVYKDIPILGPGSIIAAKAALAARAQGKYMQLHDALLESKMPLTDDSVKQIAASAGLDVDKMETDMTQDAIKQQIDDNTQLAQRIGVHGTPSLIINKHFYGGVLSQDEMAEKLKQG